MFRHQPRSPSSLQDFIAALQVLPPTSCSFTARMGCSDGCFSTWPCPTRSAAPRRVDFSTTRSSMLSNPSSWSASSYLSICSSCMPILYVVSFTFQAFLSASLRPGARQRHHNGTAARHFVSNSLRVCGPGALGARSRIFSDVALHGSSATFL